MTRFIFDKLPDPRYRIIICDVQTLNAQRSTKHTKGISNKFQLKIRTFYFIYMYELCATCELKH